MKRSSSLSWIAVVALTIMTLVSSVAAEDNFGAHYDLNGQTVTICSWVPGVPAQFLEGGASEGRLEEAERLFNTKIVFEAPGAYDQIGQAYIARLMAGESTHDIWTVQNLWGFYDVATADALYAMNDIYAKIPDSEIDGVTQSLSVDGKYFALQTDAEGTDPYIDLGLYMVAYNKDLFERESLPDLYELYKNREWTWDSMTEILKKATKDTDGDGTIDQWGINLIPPEPFILSNGGAPYVRQEDSKVVYAYDQPEVIEAINQLGEWRENGYRHDSWHFDQFINGDVAIAFGAMWLLADVRPTMDFEYGIVPYPLAPSEDRYYYPMHALQTNVLPANVEDPEALLALNSYLFGNDNDTIVEANNNTIERLCPNRESAEVVMTAATEWKGDVVLPGYTHKLFAEVLSPAFWTAINGDKSATAAMDEVKPVAQSIIDDMFN